MSASIPIAVLFGILLMVLGVRSLGARRRF
jgi:hypothetical protein